MTDGREDHPAEKYGLQVISMGFLHQRRRAGHLARPDAAQRASSSSSATCSGASSTTWSIDMPPGTGDVALSLSQTVPVAGAIVVTTPQQVSLADSRRAVRDVPEAEHPDARHHREHELLRLPELRARERHLRPRRRRADGERDGGAVPRVASRSTSRSARAATRGARWSSSEPDSPAAQAFTAAAEQAAAQVSIAQLPQARDSAGPGALVAGWTIRPQDTRW